MFPFLSADIVSSLVSSSVVEQCICYRLPAYEMVLEWVAYSSTNNGVKLQMHSLEQFQHDVTTADFISSSRFSCLCVIFSLHTNDMETIVFQGVKQED